MTTEEPAAPLPEREPHSVVVHAVIDAAVVFLAIVIVLLILDVSIWVILTIAIVIGAIAAPYTRRAEVRALAERKKVT